MIWFTNKKNFSQRLTMNNPQNQHGRKSRMITGVSVELWIVDGSWLQLANATLGDQPAFKGRDLANGSVEKLPLQLLSECIKSSPFSSAFYYKPSDILLLAPLLLLLCCRIMKKKKKCTVHSVSISPSENICLSVMDAWQETEKKN